MAEAPANSPGIKSQAHTLEGGGRRPLISSLRRRLGLLLAAGENETTWPGRPFSFVPGGGNQATVRRVFQDCIERRDRHALALRPTFSVGMDAQGATPKAQGQYPGSEFFAWLGQAQYACRAGGEGAQAVLRGNAQSSGAPLLPPERIGGNPQDDGRRFQARLDVF